MKSSFARVIPLVRGFPASSVVAPESPQLSAENAPVTRAFLEGMRIVYAFDEGSSYRWVRQEDLAQLGASPDELDELAYRNLLVKCRELQLTVHATSTGLTHLVRIGEDLEASLLMNGTVWNHFAEQLPGKLVAVCPASDVLAFGCLAVTGSLDELVSNAERVLSTVRNPVSTFVLEWEGDGWTPGTLA